MPHTPADPYNRCQRTGPFGQCGEEKVPGTDFCPSHGGRAAASKAKRRMYELAQAELQGLYGSMADREDVLSLREEVALCRMAIQKWASLMNSDTAVESKINTFNTLLLTAKTLIAECQKVEKTSGLVVERAALLNYAAELIQICGEVLENVPGHQELLEQIAARVIDAVKTAGEVQQGNLE